MGLSNIKTIGLFNVVNFAKRNLFMHLCSVCFPTTYHLCYCELWISMGSRHREETNPCLLIQGKTGNQPREGSDPGCSVFQITEDTRLRRPRNIWTPGYSNTPLKRQSPMRPTRTHKGSCLSIPAMWLWTQSISSVWLPFLWGSHPTRTY